VAANPTHRTGPVSKNRNVFLLQRAHRGKNGTAIGQKSGFPHHSLPRTDESESAKNSEKVEGFSLVRGGGGIKKKSLSMAGGGEAFPKNEKKSSGEGRDFSDRVGCGRRDNAHPPDLPAAKDALELVADEGVERLHKTPQKKAQKKNQAAISEVGSVGAAISGSGKKKTRNWSYVASAQGRACKALTKNRRIGRV